MTPEQEADLKVHVGATAWEAWEELEKGERVDLAAAMRVYGGNLRLVAAHLLRDLVERTPPGQVGVQQIKVGPIEVKLRSEAGADARSTWLTRADRLEAAALAEEDRLSVTANPTSILEPWGLDDHHR